jgi:hypothetical protein
MRGQVTEGVRNAPDAVQKNQRLLRLIAPVQKMKSQSIHIDESILRGLSESIRRHKQEQTQKTCT